MIGWNVDISREILTLKNSTDRPMKQIALILLLTIGSKAYSQQFSLKEIFTLVEVKYEDFETAASKKGFEFYRTLNPKGAPRTKYNGYHFQKLVNNKLETITYMVEVEEWRPQYKKVSVSYSTHDQASFNETKAQLKRNDFTVAETTQSPDGFTITNRYRNDKFFAYLVTTTTSRDSKYNIVTYDISVERGYLSNK